jgi:hypothetical protein
MFSVKKKGEPTGETKFEFSAARQKILPTEGEAKIEFSAGRAQTTRPL